MKARQFFPLFLILCMCSVAINGQSYIQNPVLPGIADAGVMKFNGRYYIGGVRTDGDFFVSSDLVHWGNRTHVFSMNNDWATKFDVKDNQIHANDMQYINGTFHLYWSANYWGQFYNIIHISHAESESPLGIYHEPVKDTWLDNRIDPHLFIDDDGKMYMYMVKFTDGNTIWVRQMSDPSTFTGEARYIFSSQQGNWETLDNRVAEGPWVIKYRGRYYLMYNTNHTSTSWGNYMLGVAEAAHPLEFNHGNKYSHPVVKSNQVDLEEKYVDLLKYQDNGNFRYSYDEVSPNWYTANFDDSQWNVGKSGFGFPVIKNSTTKKVSTVWEKGICKVRKAFNYNKSKNGTLSLRIHHDGKTKVYLNNTQIYADEGANYLHVDLEKHKNMIREGNNILSVESQRGTNSNFLDLALFDIKNDKVDNILYSPGQPNIVRGPNGFEWWLVYMANKNAENRGQFIDRVHFFDKKLTVDGITNAKTPGYHPLPSQPTYKLLRDESALKPNVNTTIPSTKASNYLFEANLKTTSVNHQAKSGIIAWQKDRNNKLEIFFDLENKKWSYLITNKGKKQTESFDLYPNFRADVYHKLSVQKNAGHFEVRIDDRPSSGKSVIQTDFTDEGLPGLFAENCNIEFDGITYTIGWDEYDNNMKGWESSDNIKTKGDLLETYEMSVQVSTKEYSTPAEIFPIYTDNDNNLKVRFDLNSQKVFVSEKIKGKKVSEKEISLTNLKDSYANMVNSDFLERHFVFDYPTTIDAILFNKEELSKSPDQQVENINDIYQIYYVKNGRRILIENSKTAYWEHPNMGRVEFSPIETTELIFFQKKATDEGFHYDNLELKKIWYNELVKQSYNFRIRKEKDNVSLFVDGNLIYQAKNAFGKSKVGLSNDSHINYDGITLFHLP